MLSPLALEMIEQIQLKTQAYCKNNKDDLLYPIFSNGRIRTNATMEVGFKHLCDLLDIDRDVHATRGGQKVGINLYACTLEEKNLVRGNYFPKDSQEFKDKEKKEHARRTREYRERKRQSF